MNWMKDKMMKAYYKWSKKLYSAIAALIILPFAIIAIGALTMISIWIAIMGWIEEKVLRDA